jgi:hypothetical protein
MKAKLIKQGNEYFLRSLIKDIPSSINVYHKISENEGEFGFGKHSGKLSKQNCDEIFGVVDVEKLANEYCTHEPKNVKELRDVNLVKLSFRDGFNKHAEVNKEKVFTLGQLKTAMDMARVMTDGKYVHSGEEIFQFLQQPTEIDVEIVMDKIPADLAPGGWDVFPKLDSQGCLILKKVK